MHTDTFVAADFCCQLITNDQLFSLFVAVAMICGIFCSLNGHDEKVLGLEMGGALCGEGARSMKSAERAESETATSGRPRTRSADGRCRS